jgi:hypothetical protein
LPLGSQSRLVCAGRIHRQYAGVVAHGLVDEVGEPSLEAAHRFAFGLALGSFAFVVGAALGLFADLSEGDCVERAVHLAVAAGVEPMPHGAPEEAGIGAVPLAEANRSRLG